MIEDGIFDDSVKAIFGLHVSNEIPTGKIGIRYGQMNAASDMLTLKILAKVLTEHIPMKVLMP